MRKLLLLLTSLLLIWACSSNDDDSTVNSKDNTQQTALDHDSNTEKLDTSFIEILSVDSCIGMLGSDDLSLDVDTLFAQRYDEKKYSIRVLATLMCYPAEPPDYVSYAYQNDTLALHIDKQNRSFDVLCSCIHWVNLLIKGEIDFHYIQLNGNLFVVVKKDS